MNDNILGVYASFHIDSHQNQQDSQQREQRKEQFKQELWGINGEGGLSELLKQLKSNEYGQDIRLILLQFNVDPVQGWPVPSKNIENYNPKEKSIGVWITIDDDYFLKTDKDQRLYIKTAILERLEEIKKRLVIRKLDMDMNKLLKDVDELLI